MPVMPETIPPAQGLAPIDSHSPDRSVPGTALLDALAGTIEAALARLLRLDPGSDPLLARLDGRQLRLALRGAPRGLRLRIANGRVRPIPDDPDDSSEADLALTVEPSALSTWLAEAGRGRSGLPAGIRLSGDLDLARALEQALTGFDPDWSLPFEDVFGTTFGPPLARRLAAGLAWARRQAGEFAASSAEFATEESRLVTSRSEIDEFNEQVDRLREDVERLAARIGRLAGSGSTPA